MRKTFKTCGQIWKAHFSSIVVIMLFYATLGSVIKNDLVFLIVSFFIYFSLLYTVAWEAGNKDSRKVNEFHPSFRSAFFPPLLSLTIPVFLLILRIIAFHIYPTVWGPYGDNFEFVEVSSSFFLITNTLYRAYNCYLLPLFDEKIFLTYLLPLLPPLIIFPCAYFLGVKRFDFISRFLPFLIYKKKEKNK